jgi:Phage tail lysozyme
MANQNPAVRTAFDFFMSRGYSQAQTAGIVGNLLGESSLNTGAVGDKGLAKGIAQWHPDRWNPLVSRFTAMGKDPHDLVTQLEMVDYELRNKEKGAFNRLMSAKTVDEATAAFIGFERPAGWTPTTPRNGHNYSGRLSHASEVFGLMTGVTPPPVTTLGLGGEPTGYEVGNSGNSINVGEVSQGVVPFSNAEQRAQAQAREDAMPETSLWQGVKDAINTDWSASALWRDKPEAKPDPNFRLDQPLLDKLTDGLPEKYWDRFGDAQSLTHAEGMRKALVDQLAAEQRLATMGATGIGLRLAAGVTDPLAWAAAAGVSVASMGVGAPAAVAARFGRVGMIGLSAAEAGAGTAISEGILQQSKPTAEMSDFYWGVGLGLGLGGAFGALRKNPSTVVEANKMEQIGKELRSSAAMPEGAGSTAGAQQINPRETLRSDTADIIRDAERPSMFGEGVRYDSAHSLKSSPNDLTSMLGNVLVEDGVRNSKGITPIGASEVQQRLQLQADTKWARSSKANWTDFKKRNPEATRGEFNDQVTAFARDRDLLVEYDPAVKAQGAVLRDIMGDWAEIGANPGIIDGTTKRAVRGFEGMTRNDHYVPRVFDLGAIQDALTKFGHRTVSGLIAKGMTEANKELSAALADKFAYNYVKKLHSLSAGELQHGSRAFSGEDLHGLKANLLDGTDLHESEIDAIIAHMKPGPKDGASRHGKSRMFYDENFGAVLPFSNGQPGGQFFRISDLFLNDADRLLTSYNRQMSGRVAMARMEIRNPKWKEGDLADEFFVKGVTSDGEWQTLMDKVRDVGDQLGVQGQTKKDIERLNWVYDTIVGRPKWNEGSNFNQFLRMTRDYNFVRVMGQVGFAQISEFMNMTSQLGLKASFSNMPSFRSLWRNAKTGQLDDALAQEIEDITSLGTDWVRHDSHRRHDLFDNPLDTWNSPVVQGIDDALQKGKRAVSAMSGMAPINTLLQRWTGRAIFNKFAMMAQGRTKMNPKRLEALGLDANSVETIMENIRTHATFDGNRLKAMNFQKWADRDAVANFEAAAFRLGRTIIQENDIGQMAMWMSHPLARTFLQFRSFMLASYTKQTLQGLNFRDTAAANAFIGTTVAAGLVYIAKTHLNSIGRSDRKEFLEKRLSLDRIAAAGVQNSSWASILPMMADSFIAPFRKDGPIFDARNTQLKSDALWGNPTADLGDGIFQALETIGETAIRGKKFSQADARNLLRILPFQNLNGIAQLTSGMISPLPEWSPKK